MDATRCVVFDLDDTVYLERDYVRSGFRAVGAWVQSSLGIDDFSERAWRAFERGQRHTVFDDVLRDLGVEPTPDLVGSLVDVYRRHEPSIELLPDAVEVVARLRNRAVLAALSDGPLASQRAKVRALGVERWAQAIVLTAELGDDFAKPDRRCFEQLEQLVGCSGARCVYVGDNPLKDFSGPRALGWHTVRVRRDGSLHAALQSDDDVDVEMPDLVGLEQQLSRVAC